MVIKHNGFELTGNITRSGSQTISFTPTILTGAVAPSSTPTKRGDIYIDTVTGLIYVATGTSSSSDWKVQVVSVNNKTGVITLTQDDIGDGSTYVRTENNYTDTEKTKLAGIETGAEVNNISDGQVTDLTDGGDSTLHYHSTDRNRTNHTGTQTASTISDFDTEVSNNTDVQENTIHRTSNGTDHTYIDQDVTTTGTPTFNRVTVSSYENFTPITPPTYSEGRVFYDSAKKALSYYNNESDITVNLGQEFLIAVRNETGSTIPNGALVYPIGGSGGKVLIDLADASLKDKSRLVAMATHDIENNSDGYVTRLGEVGGVDTSSYSDGTILYLSETEPGVFTNELPTDGAYLIPIGVVKVSDPTNGIIVVDPKSAELTVEVVDTNGFPSEQRYEAEISFVDGTRTFTIQPATDMFHYYQLGLKYEKFGAESVILDDITGLHIIYYDGEDLYSMANPSSGDVDTIIRTKVSIAYVYWNATTGASYYIGDERHGISMSPVTHGYLHFTRGTQYLTGLALTDIVADGSGNLDSHAQFGNGTGMVTDEDLPSIISAVTSTTGLPIFYRSGSAGAWVKTTNTGFSILTTGTGRMAYNQYTGATWQLTEISNGNYGLCHVFATNDINGNLFAIVGQNEYTNIVNARTGANEEINSLSLGGLPSQEFIPVASIIYQTNDSYLNTVNSRIRLTDTGGDYVDWRFTELQGGGSPTNHSLLSNLSSDDHLQYSLASGARAYSGIVSYSSHPTFTTDTEIVDKKYVDDAITGSGGYTDEQAQDAVGNILVDSSTIDFTYNDSTPSITASVIDTAINHNNLLNVHQDVNTTASPSFAGLDVGSSGVDKDINMYIGVAGSFEILRTDTQGFTLTSDASANNLKAKGKVTRIGTSDSQQLRLQTNNADRMTVDTDGDVGIGTLTPTAKLDVTNTADSTALFVNQDGNSNGITIDSEATTGRALDINHTSTTGRGIFIQGDSLTSGYNIFSYSNSSVATGNLNMMQADNVDCTAKVLSIVNDGTGNTLYVKTNNVGAYSAIFDGGSVGIGTTTPSEKLSVTGNIAVSGTVDGRDIATDGSKLDGIEALADVTDSTNVEAAGAIMDGDFSTNGLMKRTGVGTYSTAIEDTDYQGVLLEGAFVDGDKTKLDGIEALAEVNNISDINATDLTDGGDSTLHYHSADRDRANHTGTQTASTISDFDTEVSNNTDVAANTSARHDAVTVSDSSEIDFTLTGQQISASLITGSIDVLKLDSGVQTSLGLADSAMQDLVDDTTPQLGGNLDLNNKALTRIETAGESLSAGDLCYLKTDSKYWKADASAAATATTDLLMCNATISADATGEFIEYGEFTTTGLSAGVLYYMSETAGQIVASTSKPTTSGSIVRIIGTALSTTILKFKPDISWAELV